MSFVRLDEKIKKNLLSLVQEKGLRQTKTELLQKASEKASSVKVKFLLFENRYYLFPKELSDQPGTTYYNFVKTLKPGEAEKPTGEEESLIDVKNEIKLDMAQQAEFERFRNLFENQTFGMNSGTADTETSENIILPKLTSNINAKSWGEVSKRLISNSKLREEVKISRVLASLGDAERNVAFALINESQSITAETLITKLSESFKRSSHEIDVDMSKLRPSSDTPMRIYISRASELITEKDGNLDSKSVYNMAWTMAMLAMPQGIKTNPLFLLADNISANSTEAEKLKVYSLIDTLLAQTSSVNSFRSAMRGREKSRDRRSVSRGSYRGSNGGRSNSRSRYSKGRSSSRNGRRSGSRGRDFSQDRRYGNNRRSTSRSRNWRSRDEGKRVQFSGKGKSGNGNFKCFRCGKPNHYARDCRTRT